MNRNSYEKLKAWQVSMEACRLIFIWSDSMKEGRINYRFLTQIESSALSIPSNIAEGSGRWSKKEHLNFLFYARGSAYECMTQLALALDVGYIKQEDYSKICSKLQHSVKLLNGLIRSIKTSLNREL